jgi:hypothetical protein
MIEQFVEKWHKYLKGQLPGGLDELLAEDVIFYSPVVYTPQEGREITKLYLAAAASTFGGDEPKSNGSGATKTADPSSFRYTKEIFSGNQAVLEFESRVGGKYINGVDILECNDDGLLIEFRVMVRPLQAVNILHQQMGAMLKKMQAT